MLLNSSGAGLWLRIDHTSTAATAITAAGAGPSSAMAAEVAMKAAPMCTWPVGTARNSPRMARPSSAKNRLHGCQSPESVATTAAIRAAASRTAWPAIRMVSRRRVRCPDGTSAIAFAPNALSA